MKIFRMKKFYFVGLLLDKILRQEDAPNYGIHFRQVCNREEANVSYCPDYGST